VRLDISAKLLILDEPTSSLDKTEVEELFKKLRKLREDGLGIIFITHFLEQVYQISDLITVLRNGCRVGCFATKELPRIKLVSHMIGKAVQQVEALEQKRASTATIRSDSPYSRGASAREKGFYPAARSGYPSRRGRRSGRPSWIGPHGNGKTAFWGRSAGSGDNPNKKPGGTLQFAACGDSLCMALTPEDRRWLGSFPASPFGKILC